jgi:hypothetical protein
MLSRLQAGEASREELFALLRGESDAQRNVRAHLTAVRRHLRPRGRTVECVLVEGRTFYRLRDWSDNHVGT